MNENQETVRLGDIGKVLMCKRVLKHQTSKSGEIPFFKISTFGRKADAFITKELYDEFRNKYSHPKQGDILISAAGTVGMTVIYDGLPAYFQDSNIVWIDNDESKVLNSYLYYFYQTKPWLTTTGSTIKRIYNENLRNIKISYPNILSQKKIAEFLSTLDTKINLNNKIMTELESMAKVIYDYWFVQFDFPDITGKPYKSSGGKMAWNEKLKRKIPEGWDVLELNDVISRSATGLNPRKNFKLGSGDNYYVTIKNIEQNNVILDEKCDKIDNLALEVIDQRSDLQVGDILFTSIQPVGVTYLIQEKPKNWNINESVFTIRPNYDKVSFEYLFMILSSDEIKIFTENSSAGSIHKGIRHSILKKFKLTYKDKKIIDQFSKIASPLLRKLDIINKENRQLSQQRDFLLPMLMNGQVTVS
jgi:type I restriction enzyme, S subunit